MTDALTLHSPTKLLDALCTCIEKDIHPLSEAAVAAGSKLFGAAILLKSDLSVVYADTNQERGSPLWHGETWTLKQFFEIPVDKRPDVKNCLFLTTHEPCSLCLSAILWSGFDNFIYMYTYEETHNVFECHGDLDIFNDVFNVREGEVARQASLDGLVSQVRPQYKLRSSRLVALSFAELLAAIVDKEERSTYADKVEGLKRSYGRLSEAYRRNMSSKENTII
ncbi:cytidine deaminase-like protein [Talaromyces proteolyticus]|uniref:Cytidine deaminase-like protein n=1 Tax=Talaromyces proteolyticus TaxID=1131652 RepID=A0AAD4KJJ2_9EURO|nr:cytidine deaminase-like protein [Talaromyces proteolyticus]KAH8690722.1 cytidine deaminase-like protein [Talaromyces proteolyticus]